MRPLSTLLLVAALTAGCGDATSDPSEPTTPNNGVANNGVANNGDAHDEGDAAYSVSGTFHGDFSAEADEADLWEGFHARVNGGWLTVMLPDGAGGRFGIGVPHDEFAMPGTSPLDCFVAAHEASGLSHETAEQQGPDAETWSAACSGTVTIDQCPDTLGQVLTGRVEGATLVDFDTDEDRGSTAFEFRVLLDDVDGSIACP